MKKILIEKPDGSKEAITGKLKLKESATPEEKASLAALTSSTQDRDVYTVSLYTDKEIGEARLLNTSAFKHFEERGFFSVLKALNEITPRPNGTFFLRLGPCLSYDQSAPILELVDMCPPCEADCEDIYKAERILASYWFVFNTLKDAFLPYAPEIYDIRYQKAKERFKVDSDFAIEADSRQVLRKYVQAVNMLNYAVLISNRKKTIAALREDATGFTVQFVHAFPASLDNLEFSATLEIKPDEVTDDDKVSLWVVKDSTKLKLIYQDDEEEVIDVGIKHDGPLEKTLESGKIGAKSDKPIILNMTAMFVPFFYIKATDTTDKDITLDDVGAKATQEPAGEYEDSKFIYRLSDNKTGLVIPESPMQLEEADQDDYNESKLYPTKNVEGTDRWHLKITWNVYKEDKKSDISDVFLFEVSKVKQPVYNLVNDSTWITQIEAK